MQGIGQRSIKRGWYARYRTNCTENPISTLHLVSYLILISSLKDEFIKLCLGIFTF